MRISVVCQHPCWFNMPHHTLAKQYDCAYTHNDWCYHCQCRSEGERLRVAMASMTQHMQCAVTHNMQLKNEYIRVYTTGALSRGDMQVLCDELEGKCVALRASHDSYMRTLRRREQYFGRQAVVHVMACPLYNQNAKPAMPDVQKHIAMNKEFL